MKLVPASLRVRIIVLFSALLIVLQVLGYLLLNRASNEIAHDTLALELGVGERIFLRLLEQNRNRLEESASLLASDFAFRTAVGTGDIATVTCLSAALLSAFETLFHRRKAVLDLGFDTFDYGLVLGKGYGAFPLESGFVVTSNAPVRITQVIVDLGFIEL